MNDIIRQLLKDPAFVEGDIWKHRQFQADELLIQAGEMSQSFFFILEGTLRVTIDVELERRKNVRPGIWDLKTGDIFGESCLHLSSKPNASVTAITDGLVAEIDAVKLCDYMDSHPDRGYLFFKELFIITVQRLQRGNERIENLLAWGLRAHGIEKHL